MSETPVPPTEIVESIPRALDAVVLRALAKDPFQRFPDAATFRDALDAATHGKSPTKRQVGALTSELYGPNPRHAAETARSLRQLSTDTTMKRTQSGPPVAWIWAGVALLAVLLISVLFWVLTIRPGSGVPSGARLVPDVVGLSYDEANQKLAAQDLLARRVDQPDDKTEKGDVIRTDPDEGVSVAKDQEVTVYVSSGPDVVAVPKLVGLTQTAAEKALNDAGLILGAVTPRDDPDLAAGVVISADRQEGSSVPKGTAVNIVAATGTVTVVDVTGWTVADATKAFQDLKLTVKEQDDTTCKGSDPRTVRSQSIAPGEAPIHSTITLASCSGS